MEPARSTSSFNRKITVADSNNIVAILDLNSVNSKYQIFEQDYIVEIQAVLEDLKITVGLLSLAEAPWPDTNALMSESEQMAEIARIRTQGQKISLGLYTAIGNGPWQYESEVVLQNQGGSESHVPILVPFLSSNETLLMAGNFKLGVKIEPKWNQPLKANDYLIVKGTWRQVVSFSKKKDDDVEFLAARVEALELALQGRLTNLPANTLLGKNTGTGTVEVLPQSQFANATNVVDLSSSQVINGTKNFRNDTGTSWSRLISSNIATDAAAFIGSFVNVVGVFAHNFNLGAWKDLWLNSVELNSGGNVFFGGEAFCIGTIDKTKKLNVGGDVGISGFSTLGDNVSLKVKRLFGTTPGTQGATVGIAHNLTGDKIIGMTVKVSQGTNGGIDSAFDSFGPGYSFDCWHDASNVNIQNSPSSSQYILNKPINVLIFYLP